MSNVNDDKKTDVQQASDFLNSPEPAPVGLPTDQSLITGKALPMTMPDIGRELTAMEIAVVEQLKMVYDPEIPVDIYELGLIYNIDVDEEEQFVRVEMTLTAPGCPVAGHMPGWVEEAVLRTEGVNDCHVEMVWDPPWTMERMSDHARLELNMF